MRAVQPPQMTIGEVDISKLTFNPQSRDDIPRILKGLLYIYMNKDLLGAIFVLLMSKFLPTVSKTNGRPGMTLWTIFVCGIIRLDLNIDYDRLLELMNEHHSLRAILGHNTYYDALYHLQTIKDNVSLFTTELLDEINELIVKSGHELILREQHGEKGDDLILHARCDSFVVETNVHYPTDINLLYDATRKIIQLTAKLCKLLGLSDLRQHANIVSQVKAAMRKAQLKMRSKAKNIEQQEKNNAAIIAAHQEYIDCAKIYVDKVRQILLDVEKIDKTDIMIQDRYDARKAEIEKFIVHAERQIDQIRRRVILGEKIPHEEKVFSLFEPHTEWISKGKAGVPVEFGLKVCIMEDQYGFLLRKKVMQGQTDDKVTVEMVTETKKSFPNLVSCSFDKGFHTKENQVELTKHLELVVLPRKGKLSEVAKAIETAPEFVKARKAHSAVESAINALEVHGLDICPDHAIDAFERYVSWAMVARNIHRIGDILWNQEKDAQQGKDKHWSAKNDEKYKPDKIAA